MLGSSPEGRLRRHLPLFLIGCVAAPGDVQLVALDDVPIELVAATARVDAFLLDDCQGGTETLLVGDTVDLLTSPVPETLPPGEWCSIAVDFADDPVEGSVQLAGATSGGTSFTIDLDPGLVVLPQAFFVDSDEWVLILDAGLLVDPVPLEAQGATATVLPGDADAEALEADLPAAMRFMRVWEARDVHYVDLWPFDDVVFDFGSGDVDVRTGGCNRGGPTVLDLDLDGDGIPSSQDDDDDGDGIADLDDPDRDGDGVDDPSDPDGGSGGGDGSGGGGDGGGSGSSSGGCEGGGSGGSGGCEGGGSGGSSGCEGSGSGSGGCEGSGSSGGADCGGGGGGGADCGSGADCGECSTVGFAPPWAVGASLFVLLRRRRRERD